MKHFLTLVAMCLAFAVGAQTAQIDLPYNPDADEDSLIGTTDLLPLLALFGGEFEPDEILFNDVALVQVILTMQETITELQAQVAALENESVPGLSDHLSYDDSTNAFVLEGVNFQVTSGSVGSAGNVIIGTNDVTDYTPNPARTGKHNLIIGNGHEYTGNNGIVHGENNRLTSPYAAVIGGRKGHVTGPGAVLVGGLMNHIDTQDAAVVGGYKNFIHNSASYSAILGGEADSLFQQFTCAVGGKKNKVGEDMSQDARWSVSIAGNQNIVARTYSTTVAGAFNQTNGSRSAVIGGDGNSTSGEGSATVGGRLNLTNGPNSVTVGGQGNSTSGEGASTVGGVENSSVGARSVIIGGQTNVANGSRSIILGGRSNSTDATADGGILGGRYNVLSGEENVIVGGSYNTMENTLDENGFGVYNRWSVMLGGGSHLPNTLQDGAIMLGKLNNVYIEQADSLHHVQVGPANE